jgi:predicted nuclease of restriction endonuclease-like RecB superfamily
MLTAELLRVKSYKGQFKPKFIDVEDLELLGRAEELLAFYVAGIDEPRSSLDEILKGWVGDDPEHKLLWGLVHLVDKRAEYAVASPIPPAELRVAIFRAAARAGPLAARALEGGAATTQTIFAQVGQEKNLDPALLEGALYADHPDAMRLTKLDIPYIDNLPKAARWLLDRYNVALVQALLIQASSLHIHLDRPDPPRARQLFRAIKFHQLIHSIAIDQSEGATSYRIVLDGPASLFSQTNRYGVALASFFPALLLQPGGWSMRAPIHWRGQDRVLELDSSCGLKSHYRDMGAWMPREAEWLQERFLALKSDWELVTQTDPIRAGDTILVPDFSFRKNGRIAHLEILGFWRRGSLKIRMDQLKQPGCSNLLLAVSRKLCGDTEEQDLQGVIPFAEVIPAREVLKRIEECALPERA